MATGVVVIVGLDTERLFDATDIIDIRLEDRDGGAKVDAPEDDLRPGRSGGARNWPPGDPTESFEYPVDFLGIGTGTGRAVDDEA